LKLLNVPLKDGEITNRPSGGFFDPAKGGFIFCMKRFRTPGRALQPGGINPT
jgi:hypothetical protein